MRTMAQKRAEFALERVLAIQSDKDKFMKFANGAPAMIRQNGFGQSLAFWLAKGKGTDKYLELFDMVAKWLHLNNYINHFERAGFTKDLATMDQNKYFEAQNETLAFLEWVKRFASAGL